MTLDEADGKYPNFASEIASAFMSRLLAEQMKP